MAPTLLRLSGLLRSDVVLQCTGYRRIAPTPLCSEFSRNRGGGARQSPLIAPHFFSFFDKPVPCVPCCVVPAPFTVLVGAHGGGASKEAPYRREKGRRPCCASARRQGNAKKTCGKLEVEVQHSDFGAFRSILECLGEIAKDLRDIRGKVENPERIT